MISKKIILLIVLTIKDAYYIITTIEIMILDLQILGKRRTEMNRLQATESLRGFFRLIKWLIICFGGLIAVLVLLLPNQVENPQEFSMFYFFVALAINCIIEGIFNARIRKIEKFLRAPLTRQYIDHGPTRAKDQRIRDMTLRIVAPIKSDYREKFAFRWMIHTLNMDVRPINVNENNILKTVDKKRRKYILEYRLNTKKPSKYRKAKV